MFLGYSQDIFVLQIELLIRIYNATIAKVNKENEHPWPSNSAVSGSHWDRVGTHSDVDRAPF